MGIPNEILSCLPKDIKVITESAGCGKIEEIRLRLGMPLSVVFDGESFILGENGIVSCAEKSYIVTETDISYSVSHITCGSYYSFEESIKNGFVTLRGGHRVGIGGRGVTNGGNVVSISEISSLNFRIARQIVSCGDEAVDFIREKKNISSTLIISPPGCGKTTVLREIVRLISNAGIRVCVIDEREELCAAFEGKSAYDMGTSTDIYSGIKKSEAVYMAVRCLSPQVIVCDELGGSEDFDGVFYGACCGVRAVCSIHGSGMDDAVKKIGADRLSKCFEKFIVLGCDKRIKQKGRTEEWLCSGHSEL